MYYPSALEQLDTFYPGVCLLTLKQVATVLNRAEQTIRHQRHTGKFQIPDAPASRPRRPLFRKVDVAAFIDGVTITPATSSTPSPPSPSTPAPTTPPKRGRGRPKNAERACRLITAGGEQ